MSNSFLNPTIESLDDNKKSLPVEIFFQNGNQFRFNSVGRHIEILLLSGGYRLVSGVSSRYVTSPSYMDLLPFEEIRVDETTDDFSAIIMTTTMAAIHQMFPRPPRMPWNYLIKLRREPELKLQHDEVQLLERRALAISEVINDKKAFNYGDRIRGAYTLFATEVASVFMKQQEQEWDNGDNHQANATIYHVFSALVAEYIRQKHDVRWYADKMGVSVQHLARITKNLLKFTPKQYIDHMLMGEIQILLVTTRLSIKEIAYECNFENPDALSRFVKRVMGCNPTDIRSAL